MADLIAGWLLVRPETTLEQARRRLSAAGMRCGSPGWSPERTLAAAYRLARRRAGPRGR